MNACIRTFLLFVLIVSISAVYAVAPNANNDSLYVCSGMSGFINPVLNDTDLDGDSIWLDSLITSPNNGQAQVVGDGILYDADTAFLGYDTASYVLIDSTGVRDTAIIVFFVDSCSFTNNPPNANFDLFIGFEDFPVLLNFLDNDVDPDSNNLEDSIILGPFLGEVNQVFGQLVYIPPDDYVGLDFILYRACDDGSPVLCDFALAVVTLLPFNDVPVGVNDTVNMQEDESISIDVLMNDIDVDGDPLRITAVSGALNGSTHASSDSLTVVYTPNQDWNGTEVLTYTVCDNSSACDDAEVYITVLPVNDVPIAVDDQHVMGAHSDVPVLTNDVDPDGDALTIEILSQPTAAFVTVMDTIIHVDRFQDITSLVDSFRYRIFDGQFYDSATVYLTYMPDNLDPLVAKGLSPNGDGLNDTWEISNIDLLGRVEARIFNRYGDLIFESLDYKNQWDGTFQFTLEPAPDGTYFYIVLLPESGLSTNGSLEINR